MRRALKRWVQRRLDPTCDRRLDLLCRREYETQQFQGLNERSIEYRFVFAQLTRVCPQTVLDVGTGMTALPHLLRTCGFVVTATDNTRDYWPEGMVNRHWHVIDDDIANSRIASPFDFITCISVLEHVVDHDRAVQKMTGLLPPGGHLVMSFPYNERRYVENVYRLPASSEYEVEWPFKTSAYSREQVDRWLEQCDCRVIEQEYWQFYSGDYWTVGEQLPIPRQVTAEDPHQITCLMLRKSGA